MTVVTMDTWIDELAVSVPSAGEKVLKQALRATFRQFCTESGAWVRLLPAVDIVAGQSEYDLEQDLDDASVLYPLAVFYQQPNMRAVPLPPIQGPAHLVAQPQSTGRPSGYTGNAEDPCKITLVPAMNVSVIGGLIPYVALGPKDPFDDMFPRSFQTHHFDKLLDGAKGRLMGVQDRPYTNLIAAQYHLRKFQIGMAAARDMARKQFTAAETQFAFPNWAASSTHGSKTSGWH